MSIYQGPIGANEALFVNLATLRLCGWRGGHLHLDEALVLFPMPPPQLPKL